MRWVDFDELVARSFVSQCRDSARRLREQSGGRGYREGLVLESFSGPYSVLFRDNCLRESSDRLALAGALEELSFQVGRIIDQAVREEGRRQRVEDERRRREEESDVYSPFFTDFETEFFPPVLSVVFFAHSRVRVSRNQCASRVGGSPSSLRGFAQHACVMNDVLASEQDKVRCAWGAFVSSCAWAGVGSFPLGQWGRLLEENRTDERWVIRIAEAFEAAGSNGVVTNLDISAGVASFDPAAIPLLLGNLDLSAEQLQVLVERLAEDPQNHLSLVQYADKYMDNLNKRGSEKLPEYLSRATALISGISTSAPASALLLRTVGADRLCFHLEFAMNQRFPRGNGQDGSVEFAGALREVFRRGEPHLASISPGLSQDFATQLLRPLPSGEGLFHDVYAISYLLHASTLSTPFLDAFGKRLNVLDRELTGAGADWYLGSPVKVPARFFPLDRVDAAYDLGVSYMDALGRNSEAAAHFLNPSDQNNLQYWIQDRAWGHDNFVSLMSALDAAITQGENAGTENAAKLTSSLVYYLAHRPTGIADEKFAPGSIGEVASEKMANILANNLPAIELALRNLNSRVLPGEIEDPVFFPHMSRIEFPAKLNFDDLRFVTQAALSHDSGLAWLRQGLTRYEDAQLAGVADIYHGKNPTAQGGDFGSVLRNALDAQGKLEGFFVNQISDVEVDLAREKDERVRGWIGLGKDLAGEIPISKIPRVGYVADKAFAYGVDAGAQRLEQALAHYESMAVEQADQRVQATIEAHTETVFRALYNGGVISREELVTHARLNSISDTELDAWIERDFREDGSENNKYHHTMEGLAGIKGDLHSFENAYKDAVLDGKIDRK